MKKNYGISILLCTAILCALYAGSYQSMYAEDSQTEHTEELSIAPAEGYLLLLRTSTVERVTKNISSADYKG